MFRNSLHLLVCVFCLVLICSLNAFPQDAEVNSKEDPQEVTDNGELKAEDRDVDANGQDRQAFGKGLSKNRGMEGSSRVSQGRQQDGQSRQLPGGLPQELQKILKEENISQEDLKNNPEIRKRVFQKLARMRKESSKNSEPKEDRLEKSQGEPAEPSEDSQPRTEAAESPRRGPGGPRDESADEKMKPYMSIVENNLFRSLGSGGEERRSSFALTAVISSNPEEADKAIIEEIGGEKSYYVSEGDVFADEIEVVDIGDQVVNLDRSGKEERLRLGEGTSSGRRGGGGRRAGGRQGESGESRPGGGGESGSTPGRRGGNFDASRLPPFAQQIMRERGISMEQLRNNPALQQRLRSEIGARMRGGSQGRPGGDRSRQPMRLERGRPGGRDRR